MSESTHTPVLLRETLDLLNLRTGTHVIDCTLGLGGHARWVLEKIGREGRLLAFEQDEQNLKQARARLKIYEEQVIYVHGNFEHLREEIKRHYFSPVSAILFDLGLSSPHLDNAERGFSFRTKGPLDMRFNPRQKLTAEHIVNTYSERALADLIYQYGEERRSRIIAKALVQVRKVKPIRTTKELSDLVQKTLKFRGKIHPATLTFQALRIAVNRELEVLETALKQAVEVLEPGGRIAVISYHSLEDRIVKNKFRHYTLNCICPKELPICQCNFKKSLYLVTKKPIIPSGIEVLANPRSRSAKLRVAQKLG